MVWHAAYNTLRLLLYWLLYVKQSCCDSDERGIKMDFGMNEMIQRKEERELEELRQTNERSGLYGLTLNGEETKALMKARNESLKQYQRVEFSKGILNKLVNLFCDSQYLYQDNYVDTLIELQNIFYEFKNESQDKLSDDELLAFMKEQFETVCFGDTQYLEETCLSRFTKAIRAGYKGYENSGGQGEYGKLKEEVGWDSELYMEALKDLCWK